MQVIHEENQIEDEDQDPSKQETPQQGKIIKSYPLCFVLFLAIIIAKIECNRSSSKSDDFKLPPLIEKSGGRNFMAHICFVLFENHILNNIFLFSIFRKKN